MAGQDSSKPRQKRGPIIVSRHGRPALDRTAKPRLGWEDYRDWWERYEIGPLAKDQAAPEALKEMVADADKVFASARLRAQETAAWAMPHKQAEFDAVFNEAPLPPPRFPGVRFLPKTWNIWARSAWFFGHSLDMESVHDARARADAAADKLHNESEGAKVYVAAHGWFNRMLKRAMKRKNWKCVRDGGDSYWSFRIYEYQGDD
jgi:broad specificity phosphatase PhoE